MKKWIALFLLVAMTLSLVACGIAEEQTAPSTEAVEETKETSAIVEETTETSEVAEETTEIVEETTETLAETTEIEETETELAQPETFWAEEDVEFPMSFYFSSGAGGWGTELVLYEDGSFTGSFRDTNMGEIGENNPNGTAYVCSFSGKFSTAERLDMYTYGMKLLELNLDRPAGEEWIEDGVRYISATPYGLENSEDFAIYLPNTPVEMLSEDVWFWWPGRYHEDYTTLNGYGLCNLSDDSCFFSMIDSE